MDTISEGAREWETFKYDSFHIPSAVYNDPDRPIPFSTLSSSPDTGLTAFAQLGALRLNASRALISLFDRQHQYIVAEATRSMPLSPNVKYQTQNHLWLCGTAIPRAFGICEHVLVGATSGKSLNIPQAPSANKADKLPVAIVPDLATDQRFCDRPYIDAAPYNRFYAGVPIRSPKGINIGVYCIFDDRPRSGLDVDSIQFLRDMSQTIMDYLDARRVNETYRRSEHMVQGLGDFIEGRDEPSPAPQRPPSRPSLNGHEASKLAAFIAAAAEPSPRSPDVVDSIRPSINPISPDSSNMSTKVDSSDSVETTATTATVATTTSSTAPPDPHLTETVKVFSRAAHVIRKSLEVDGVVFLDASVGSFGGLVSGPRRASEVADSHFSSSDESLSERAEDAKDGWCKSFGKSSTTEDMVNGVEVSQTGRFTLREKFLRKLLRRYPNGKVFSYDEMGNWYSADSETDDTDITPTEEIQQPVSTGAKATYSYFTRRNEAKIIIDQFPGARSVAVVPLWDSTRERCFAGGFVWSETPSRILTPDADLPYLRAFGMVTMAELSRIDALIADRAKADILGSLSHELRSPLHGVVAAAELLHDTQLDAFQVDVIHTIEISGKTLLDTIDHLLDYSKVNTYLRASKSQRKNNGPGRGLRPETSASIESGMMTLVSDVHLDLLVEEVIESVFIGYSFQSMVAYQLARHGPSSGPPTPAQEKLDAIATSDGLGHRRCLSEEQPALRDVKILVDIDPLCSWVFHTNPGAIRRIVMNLFGNALKYTTRGFIKVNLRQEEVVHKSSRSASMVVLTVTDSGKGISEDFLRNKLFTPFSQEDSMAPGTGLGLSLVRQIVTGLGGTISVKSQIGYGTSVTVSVPLVLSRRADSRGRKFSADLDSLAGSQLAVRGFSRGMDDSEELRAGGLDLPVESLPFNWLDVRVNEDNAATYSSADLMVCSEEAFKKLGLSSTGGVDTPVVVVCSNAEAAQKLATSYRRSLRQESVMEFIAQPTGPRKVAKALACALDRWKQRQAAKSTTSGLPSESAMGLNMSKPEFLTRPRAQSETVKIVRVASPPAELDSQSPGDSWIANTNDPSFTLTLPFRPAASVVAPPATSTISAVGSVNSVISGSSSSAKSPLEFLLVDDNPINLKILSAYMKRLQKRHATASNGLEALQAYTIQPQRFCCILIDITMPVMDGLEATRRIRKFERAHHLPPVTVIAITSLGSASARQEGFASGMDLFLTRPVTMTELVKILKQRRLVDEEAEKRVLSK
ncbi:Sensor protein GacS [Colletotrichum chlorophyti]|uniref:Sensor protein GacS n=1 Tax=Colletotrichum chlorophyti TaxID=708187 RepID=A0A1Q8S616_9PEZI|nr:Sensor protein GacS [Colletotrichum chlorophyti]